LWLIFSSPPPPIKNPPCFLKNPPFSPKKKGGGGNGDLPNFQVLPPDLPIFAVVPPRTKPVVFISPPKEKLWALRQRGEWNSWARNRCRGTEINQKEKVRVGAYSHCFTRFVCRPLHFLSTSRSEATRYESGDTRWAWGLSNLFGKRKGGWGETIVGRLLPTTKRGDTKRTWLLFSRSWKIQNKRMQRTKTGVNTRDRHRLGRSLKLLQESFTIFTKSKGFHDIFDSNLVVGTQTHWKGS